MHFIGDGPEASILEQANTSANAVTIYPVSGAVQPNVWACNGSVENMTINALGGHLHTARYVSFLHEGWPDDSGANAGWEYDIWNGSSWVNALGISGQSNATANLRVTGATEVQGG
jgi:hypothetical protein